MKAFLIVGNSTLEEDIRSVLEELKVDGYTQWSLVKGKGDAGFHLGTPIWPSLNEVFLVVVSAEKAEFLVEALKDMRRRREIKEEGLEVFFWEVERIE